MTEQRSNSATPTTPLFDLIVTDTSVLSLDDAASSSRGDLLVHAGRFVHVGSWDGALHRTAGAAATAARTILDGSRGVAVPLVVKTLEDERSASTRVRDKVLVTGNEATFALIGRRVTQQEAWNALVVRPEDLLALVLRGRLAVRGGSLTDAVTPTATEESAMAGPDRDDPRLGTWVDRSGWLEQTLEPDGRYHETRGGRSRAYTGRYWLSDDRIVYFDDSGFWAFGEFEAGRLHHAGYVMRLREEDRRRRPSSAREHVAAEDGER